MVERIPNSGINSPTPVDSESTQPSDKNIEKAASEFKSMLDDDRKTPEKGDKKETSDKNETSEKKKTPGKKEISGKKEALDAEGKQTAGKSAANRPMNKLKEGAGTSSGKQDGDNPALEQRKKDDSLASDQEPVVSGDAILARMSGSETQPGQAVESVAQPDATADLDGIVQQVADQILVSEASSGREVRIVLKNSVLPGTEVRIVEEGGKMQVQFVTSSSESQQMLNQNLTSLQNSLNEKVSQHDFVVSVEMDGSADQDTSDGRSRNRQEIGELPEDDQA